MVFIPSAPGKLSTTYKHYRVHLTSIICWDLKFLQQHCWRCKSSSTLHPINWQRIPIHYNENLPNAGSPLFPSYHYTQYPWLYNRPYFTASIFFLGCVTPKMKALWSFNTWVYQKVPRLSSTDRKQMALGEYLRYDWEMATLPLSVPSGFAVWTSGVAQHEC